MREHYLKKNRRSLAKSPGETKRITMNVVFEVLDSCAHRCPGCFVNRSNSFVPAELDRFIDWVKRAHYTERNAATFGPTDIFSATNFDEVFVPGTDVIEFCRSFVELSFNSTLMDDLEKIKTRVARLLALFPGQNLEFFVIVDVDKVFAEDAEYLAMLDEKIEVIKDYNVILTANIVPEFQKSQERLVAFAAQRYGVNFKWNPSFLRAKSDAIVDAGIRDWATNSYLDLNLLDYATDPYFGGASYKGFAFHRGKAYRIPCLMDFTPVDRATFEIDLNQDEDHRPFLLSPARDECADCCSRIACGAKGVHRFKEAFDLSGCIMPKHFKRG